MHIVFYCHKKSFLIIKIKLRHCITLKKNYLRKTILLYITVTVSRRTYLSIDQTMKRNLQAVSQTRGSTTCLTLIS